MYAWTSQFLKNKFQKMFGKYTNFASDGSFLVRKGPLGEAAPRPSLFRGVRQFVWNHLESVSCHFCGQGFWSSIEQGKWCEKNQATAQQSNCSL